MSTLASRFLYGRKIGSGSFGVVYNGNPFNLM